MTYEAHKTLHRLAERDRERQTNRLLRDVQRAGSCPACDGLGFQAGAHTTTVNDCPGCAGSGRVIALRPCQFCGDPSEPGLRICPACSREEALD